MDTKALGLLGSLGAAATGGGIYWAVKDSTKPISQLLSSEKALLLITHDSDEKGNSAGKNYRNAHKEGGDINYKAHDKGGIKGWENKRAVDTAPPEFKEECKRQSQLEVYGKDDQKYKDVKAWCTRPKKISELLSGEGERVLLNETGDEEAGGKSGGEYRKRHEKSRQDSSVTYEDSDELSVNQGQTKRSEEQVPQEYKQSCKTKSGEYINIEQATEDPTFAKVKKGCTKPKS